MTILARGKCWSFSSRGYPFPRQSFLDGAREYLDGALKCRNNNNPDVPPPDFINLYYGYVAIYLAPIHNFVIDPSELIIVGKYLRSKHILRTFFSRLPSFISEHVTTSEDSEISTDFSSSSSVKVVFLDLSQTIADAAYNKTIKVARGEDELLQINSRKLRLKN